MKSHLSDAVHASSRALFRQLRRARQGHRRGIHQARVASRRLREALPVVPSSGRGRRRDHLIRDIRRIGRALGTVRELDVALKELDRHESRPSFDPAAVAHVVEYLKEQRAERMHELEHKLELVDLKKLSCGIEELAERCAASRASSRQNQVAVRLRAHAKQLGVALRAAGTMYAAEPIHEVRVAGKKLRYTLELARTAADAQVSRDLATLKRLQQLLGRLHDRQVLQQFIREAAAASDHMAIGHGLEAMHHDLEQECRQLHARFLSKVNQWTRVAERGRRDLPATIGARRVARVLTADPSAVPVMRALRTA